MIFPSIACFTAIAISTLSKSTYAKPLWFPVDLNVGMRIAAGATPSRPISNARFDSKHPGCRLLNESVADGGACDSTSDRDTRTAFHGLGAEHVKHSPRRAKFTWVHAGQSQSFFFGSAASSEPKAFERRAWRGLLYSIVSFLPPISYDARYGDAMSCAVSSSVPYVTNAIPRLFPVSLSKLHRTDSGREKCAKYALASASFASNGRPCDDARWVRRWVGGGHRG